MLKFLIGNFFSIYSGICLICLSLSGVAHLERKKKLADLLLVGGLVFFLLAMVNKILFLFSGALKLLLFHYSEVIDRNCTRLKHNIIIFC